MKRRLKRTRWSQRITCGGAIISLLAAGTPMQVWAHSSGTDTATPIKHVIVLIGENRSFDHSFATYQPKQHQSVANLLSEGIILADGSPEYAFAIEKRVGGHVFQLQFGNSAAMTYAQIAKGGNPGGLYFGFNLSRKFF